MGSPRRSDFVIFGGFLVVLAVIKFRSRAGGRARAQAQVPATPRAQTTSENDSVSAKINKKRPDRKGSLAMAQTLLDGFWYDRPATLEACFEEIATIDRVINLRIKNALKARAAGVLSHPLDAGRLVDDLLYRRQRFSDLAECIMIESTWPEREQDIFRILTYRVSKRPKHPRFVG